MTRRRRIHRPGQAALEYEYHSFPPGLDGRGGGFGGASGMAINTPSQGDWVRLGRQTSEMAQACLSCTGSL
jgi:hypothetical protein